MACRAKAARQLWLHLHSASLHLEHLAASIAVKMMVVLFPGDLVSRRLTGDLHWSQPFVLNQRPDVPVYGRNADTFDLLLGVGKCLFWREWSVCTDKGITNCILLPGFA
jgi:hypothetical protein